MNFLPEDPAGVAQRIQREDFGRSDNRQARNADAGSIYSSFLVETNLTQVAFL